MTGGIGMLRRWSGITGAVLCVAAASTVQAQVTCGATGNAGVNCTPAGVQVTTTVQRIIVLSVDQASVALTPPTHTDFETSATAVIEDLTGHELTVRANTNWDLTIAGAAWTAPWVKPVGDLEYTSDGGTSWDPMTLVDAAITSGLKTAGQVVNLGYRTTWNIVNDEPGVYTMALTLRIASP